MMSASDIPLYGIDKELAAKQAAKYDPAREREAIEWLSLVLEESLDGNDIGEILHDGIVLARVMSKFFPGKIKINKSKLPFMQMENINNFLVMAKNELKVPPQDLFQTVDLYERKNIPQVIDAIYSVSRHAQAVGVWDGPILGPRLAQRRSVNFSDEVLNAGKNVLSLQYGYNKGATQSGQVFGGRRSVVDTKIDSNCDNSVPSVLLGYAGGASQSGIVFGGRRSIGNLNSGQQ